MRIEQVNFHYLAIDRIRDIGDGSQDALLVEVGFDDGTVGWGECEAAPLVSIAAWCCPMSHFGCKPLQATVPGTRIDRPEDIFALTCRVRRNSFDLLQADHTLSGIDMALWDALGKKTGRPVWSLLGYERSYPKIAYASQLFGDTPEQTFEKAKRSADQGYRAAKFGWGPFGLGGVAEDEAQIRAARAGLGPERALMIDAGTVWGEDVEKAAARLPVLRECGAVWLEEPFSAGALQSYGALAARCGGSLRLAGGEGSHDPATARNLIDFGRPGFIQIDAGRVGGISSAFQVAQYAQARGLTYVNHTFTTMLALSASLQPFAGMAESRWCEYPVESSELARTLTCGRIEPGAAGEIMLPDTPGLGVEIDPRAIGRYGRKVEIRYENRQLWGSK